MRGRRPARLIALTLGATLLGLMAPAGSANAAAGEVDESRLQPALSPTFAPWDCTLKASGPVCTGERHLTFGWEPNPDFACAVPLWGARTEDRYQTRFYDQDYLNYDRAFRTRDTDFLSTSPTGPATATIDANLRFTEQFAVPGDDSTLTVISSGTIWDIRPVNGPPVFRAVGALVEPFDGPATFTGHVTIDGVTTRYVDAPLESFFTFESFSEWVCQAATGSGSTVGA